jgi:CRISPR system Cascade subunit CasD
MQSWGTTSRFDQRDTGKEPSKSGVIGLLAAALGYDREDWKNVEPLTRLRMGVRHDRPGILKRDYQTAGCASPNEIIKADGKLSEMGVVSERFYLSDACFLVGIEGSDSALLEEAHNALRNPKWVLSLGRKSYVPSEPVWLFDGFRRDEDLREALIKYPRITRGAARSQLLFSFESTDFSGRMVMDQPLSNFIERRFGARFVVSEWLPFSKEAAHVAS